MSRCIFLRFVLPTLALAGFLGTTAAAQSQDTQSVAEAARHARDEKKKAAAKPARVITDDEVKPAEPSGSGATPAPANSQVPSNQANAQTAPGTSGAPAQKENAKEIAAVKELLKQIRSDLDLLQRDQALQKDTYYSNPDYIHDLAGKSKLDAMKQEIGDKQQELDQLKAKLAELGVTLDKPEATPPKP